MLPYDVISTYKIKLIYSHICISDYNRLLLNSPVRYSTNYLNYSVLSPEIYVAKSRAEFIFNSLLNTQAKNILVLMFEYSL